jgi:lipopolysaccharide/colanic/teichoic acid biosynthesis glycosyltransferase
MPGMTRPVLLRVPDEKQSVPCFELSLTPPVRPGWELMGKRTCDVVFSTLGLLVLSPVFLILGILVKLQDGGPVFHRRRVISPRGSFDAFKFRSMRPDADAVLHGDVAMQGLFERNFKLEHDPRVTPLGALLRKYSLDELPQLLNVLCGQMSLVGPRMITANELPKYGKYQKLLLSVKPGLTGYWQVHGRQNVGYSRRVEMDIYYIRNWSLKLDLRILLHTPSAVMKGSGAF